MECGALYASRMYLRDGTPPLCLSAFFGVRRSAPRIPVESFPRELDAALLSRRCKCELRTSSDSPRILLAALPFLRVKRKLPAMPDWPHSPAHRLDASGAYIVTAGTYQKQPFFRSAKRLTYLCESLLQMAASHGWNLEAWAVFPNHYHFVATSPRRASTLRQFIGHLHTITAKEINRQDEIPARKVWFQYWESKLTYQKSFFARLNYVHSNAVHHGLVRKPEQYEWCSAGWFQRKAEKSFYQTVMQVRSERIRLVDDYLVDVGDIL